MTQPADTQPKGAILMTASRNRKTGPVAVTHVSKATCPTTCPFYQNGCYADYGHQRYTTNRLNQQTDPIKASRQEATAIRAQAKRGALPLRLHVVGDFIPQTAQEVADAARHYRAKSSQPVWGYTHRWSEIPARTFDGLAILASVETPEQAQQAYLQGYAPALVVERHPQDGRAYEQNGLRMVPCPEQTRGRTCNECRLCWDTERLRARRIVVLFALHGTGKKRAAAAIKRTPDLIRETPDLIRMARERERETVA